MILISVKLVHSENIPALSETSLKIETQTSTISSCPTWKKMMKIITFYSSTPLSVCWSGDVNAQLVFWCRRVSFCYVSSEMRGVAAVLIFGKVCNANTLYVRDINFKNKQNQSAVGDGGVVLWSCWGRRGCGAFPLFEPCLGFLRTLCSCPDSVLRFLALQAMQPVRSRELEKSRDMPPLFPSTVFT